MGNFSNISNLATGAYNAMKSLTGVMDTYIQKANAAAEAQTKLTTVMRQRMDATEADVAAVNAAVKAQTELGVVGGTVQRQGLQQLATFAAQKQTLIALLPAMNNLLTQQKGLNATSEDAVGIANLLGKALQGQTSALKRVGITFSDAQAEAIKAGDACRVFQPLLDAVKALHPPGAMEKLAAYDSDLQIVSASTSNGVTQ